MTTQLELSTLRRTWIEEVKENFWKLGGRKQISSDDIHEFFGAPPHPNHYGSLFAQLQNAGMVREIGRVKSKRVERNCAKISLWEVV